MLTTQNPQTLGACKSNAKKAKKHVVAPNVCKKQPEQRNWQLEHVRPIVSTGPRILPLTRQTPGREEGNHSDFSPNLKQLINLMMREESIDFYFIQCQNKDDCHNVKTYSCKSLCWNLRKARPVL